MNNWSAAAFRALTVLASRRSTQHVLFKSTSSNYQRYHTSSWIQFQARKREDLLFEAYLCLGIIERCVINGLLICGAVVRGRCLNGDHMIYRLLLLSPPAVGSHDQRGRCLWLNFPLVDLKATTNSGLCHVNMPCSDATVFLPLLHVRVIILGFYVRFQLNLVSFAWNSCSRS